MFDIAQPTETHIVNSVHNIHDVDSFIEFNRIGFGFYPEVYIIFVCLAGYVMLKTYKYSNQVVKRQCLKE
jgi:hypothetical protein